MSGSKTQRGDSYLIRVSGGFDANGKRQRLNATVRREAGMTAKQWERAAEKKLRDLLTEAERNEDVNGARAPVAKVLERWLEHCRAKNLRPKTIRRYEELVRLWIVPVIGDVKLAKLRPAHVEQVLDAVRKQRSPKTVRDVRQAMSTAFRLAVRWGLLTRDPAAAIDPPKVARRALVVPQAPELDRLLDLAEERDELAGVAVLVGTGMRRSECLAMRWRHTDLDAAVTSIVEGLHRDPHEDGRPGRLSFYENKSQRSRRGVPLPEFVVDALRAHKAEQEQRREDVAEDWHEEDLVFPSWNGRPRDPDAWGKSIRRLMVDAGLDPKTRLHDLRHGFATLMLRQKVQPAVVSAMLGHSSPAFTASVYQHVMADMARDAADAVQHALRRPKDRPRLRSVPTGHKLSTSAAGR